MWIFIGRTAQRAALPILFLLRLIFQFFAPKGRHVAPVKVKFGRKDGT